MSVNRVTVRYGSLELVSTATGDVETSISPLTTVPSASETTYTFTNNVVATATSEANSVELNDISTTVTHTFAPDGLERVVIDVADSSQLLTALGLCGDVSGALVIGDTAEQVTDLSDAAQIERFSSSWELPARLQTSTIESCSKNDVII